ncbi:FmdB family zinc ribbon protein [Candidatus Oscillochloris fontis]|uniref:FmdB family zinc ribbon protein n=1 Tax=Candidatus Oscillochloris fontis TaxID=2496868 RepID=UPI00101CF2AB|nr:zinc ribbon domain-containing protein [Candidatus Oscillochloris fontis]
MPLYEYQCPDCESRFERLVRSTESAPKVVCPTCGGDQAERILSMFATSGPRGGSASSSSSSGASCGPVG